MSRFIKFVTKLIPHEPPTQLGRWALEICPKRIDTKVDRSNEDHCGPCGQYKPPTKPIRVPVHKTGLNYKSVQHIEYE